MDCGALFEELSCSEPRKELTRAGSWFALTTDLSILAKMEATPLMMLRYSGTMLCERLPADDIPKTARKILGGEFALYRGFRRRLLDLQLLATRSRVDEDPIRGLQRLARLEIRPSAENPFYELGRVLNATLEPCELSRRIAIDLDKNLTGLNRQTFRAALGTLDRLHGSALAQATGLLPKNIIGFLPKPSDNAYITPLSPNLAQLHETAEPPLRSAISAGYRVALGLQLFNDAEDPTLKELLSERNIERLMNTDPASLGIKRLKPATFRAYVNRLIKACSKMN